ncbi:MAG: hypothetical protein P1P82_08130 [Bacteroidales bacterium]|nr:hypothetical protein [Bacteroidales bacterium]MDT8430319.1 hypothetical protein [Bacteroidales bacterium]
MLAKKRIVRLFAGMCILSAFALPSCDFLQDCGTCEEVRDDGTDITYGPSQLVCGDAFYSLADSDPVTDNNGVTTYWNCY